MKAGNLETAAHPAQLANGHRQHPAHHAGEAAKAHIRDHDKSKIAKVCVRPARYVRLTRDCALGGWRTHWRQLRWRNHPDRLANRQGP